MSEPPISSRGSGPTKVPIIAAAVIVVLLAAGVIVFALVGGGNEKVAGKSLGGNIGGIAQFGTDQPSAGSTGSSGSAGSSAGSTASGSAGATANATASASSSGTAGATSSVSVSAGPSGTTTVSGPPRPSGSTAPPNGPSIDSSKVVADRYFSDLNSKNTSDARTLLCEDAKSGFDTTITQPNNDFSFTWSKITYVSAGAVNSDITVLTYQSTLTNSSKSDDLTVLLYFVDENGVKLCGEDSD